ncbi:MAG TPA: cytochrome c oxidase subunit II, partial [Actinomycetota bacterium]|nr:cytochrome c oxidase subunit II [Actinomycetota bacterium]
VGLLAAVLIVLPLTFGMPPGWGLPEPVTPSGRAIDDIYWVVFGLAAFVFLLVEGALLLFIFRFRRRPDAREDVEGPQIHGNTRVEIVWTLVPVLLLVAIAAFVLAQLPTVQAAPADGQGERIRVTAHQFYWQYEYPNGALSFDALYLPVDRNVSLALESADVVHSWWVPKLTGKRDAIPGRTNVLSFRPTRTGALENGKCGEFCGIQHARMLTRVEVLPQEEYDRWLDENAPDGGDDLAALGEAEWAAACAKCHGPEGEGDIGPPIAGNGALREADSLRRLLYEGQDLDSNPGYMPPVGRGWSDRQIEALLAYVEATPALAEPPQGGETDGG